MPAEAGHLTSLHPHCYDPNTLWLALNKAKGRSSLVVRVRVKKKKTQRSPAFLLTPGVSLCFPFSTPTVQWGLAPALTGVSTGSCGATTARQLCSGFRLQQPFCGEWSQGEAV